VIDGIRDTCTEITERIVGERGEVNERVETLEVRHLHIADVTPDRVLGPCEILPEGALLVVEGVEAGHLVSCPGQHRYKDAADVAVVATYEHSQVSPPPIAVSVHAHGYGPLSSAHTAVFPEIL
jgi:hypothetical protein